MNCINIFINFISLVASLITIIALWSNISAMRFNYRKFRQGGYRITFDSGAYIIKSGDMNGDIIYNSSKKESDYKQYAEKGRELKIEFIEPFLKWNKAHWVDDIRVPNYPLQLL